MADEHSSHAATQEDVTSKYKRLLSLARSNLETNQKQLAEKDLQITGLIAALEEERSKRLAQGRIAREEDGQQFPRRILCRVEVEGVIWILVEYESAEDEWKCFNDDRALNEFIRRLPGAPLIVPQKCLSVEESSRLIEESRLKLEKISEEFRRYKVKMEINLKQREAEQKPPQLPSVSSLGSLRSSTGGGSNGALPSSLERALSQGSLTHANIYQSDTEKLRIELQEKENRWRMACEKLTKELETLKTKGAESVVAAQWRQRYESCLRDKEEMQAKLSLYTHLSSEVLENGQSVEQLYIELQEEYKGLRRRLREVVQEYTSKGGGQIAPSDYTEVVDEVLSAVEYYRIDQKDMDDARLLQPIKLATSPRTRGNGAVVAGSSLATGADSFTAGKGMAESKVQYVRHMIFQFLVCREPEVRAHIEAALMALFRFSEEERAAVASKAVEDSQDTLTSITNFIGSFTG